MVDEAYGAFAYAYDRALGLRFFRAVKPLIDRALRGRDAATHLDLACGTGLALEWFQSRGWRSVGVDASLAMLGVARGRAERLVAGDFRQPPLRGQFALITCLYDSINHLKNRRDLAAFFRSASRLLAADGLLLFDINHAAAYRVTWGAREPFISRGADHWLELATTFREREGVARALVTGWVIRHGERITVRERREQRAWTEREVGHALTAAGIEVEKVIPFDPFRSDASRHPLKLFYVCAAGNRPDAPAR